MAEKPIARCEANGVEAYDYPFYVKPAYGMEPAYIFLEDHLYNFNTEEMEETMAHLVRVEKEDDLKAFGCKKNADGIYVLGEPEERSFHGGKS